MLGSTAERVALPDDLVARLEGKSSLGRLGLLIHSTAGYIDPGFDGTITLELSNVARLPISIYPGMAIGQISFLQMTTPVERPYQRQVPGAERARRPARSTGSSTARGVSRPRTARRRPAGRSQEFATMPPSSGEGQRPRRPPAASRGRSPATSARRIRPPTASMTRASAMKPAWMT